VDVERWRQLSKVFHDVLEQAPETRMAFLDRVCSDDPSLRTEVESLIRAHNQPGTFSNVTSVNEFTPTGLKAPSTIGHRYEVLDRLGSGGMGFVYKARDRETGTVLAVKVLHPAIAVEPALIERFKSEVILARKVTHKNVCRVYDFNRFGDVIAISMEYIEGETLRTLLRRAQGISVDYGLNIVHQILAGLAEAHSQKITHRDLKPENIVIGSDGIAKIMDFGIARSAEINSTVPGAVLGTPSYMSPEQASGKAVDARSDIYSLGLVMYEIFSGHAAFSGDSPLSVAIKQMHEIPLQPLELQPHIPAFLNRAILKCIEKDASKRFQTVADLEAALDVNQDAIHHYHRGGRSDIVVPVYIDNWKRSDSLLLALATFGLTVFVVLFPRFHPGAKLSIQVPAPPPILEGPLFSLWKVTALADVVLFGQRFLSPFDLPVPPIRYIFVGPVVGLLVLLLFFARKIYRDARCYPNLLLATVAGFAVLKASMPHVSDSFVLVNASAVAARFLVALLITYALLNTAIHYVSNRCPELIDNYPRSLGKFLPRILGLQLMRGILCGTLFASIWMMLVAVSERVGVAGGTLFWFQLVTYNVTAGAGYNDAFVSMQHVVFTYLTGKVFPTEMPRLFGLQVLGETLPSLLVVETLLVPSLLIALPLALTTKLAQGHFARLSVLAVLWVVLGFTLAGAMTFPSPAFYFFGAIQAISLGYIFLRYGFISTMSAVFTVEIMLLALPLLVAVRYRDPLPFAAMISAWLLILLAACLLYFRSHLRAAYKRVVDVFD
jgi:predicted Ser/Thr protein kinase